MNPVKSGRELPKCPESFREVADSQTIVLEGRKYERLLYERPLHPFTRLIKIIAAVALTVLTGFVALFFACARELWRECLTGKECRVFSVPAESTLRGDPSRHLFGAPPSVLPVDEPVLSAEPEIYDYREFIANLQANWRVCVTPNGELTSRQRTILARMIISDCSDLELIKFLENCGFCSWIKAPHIIYSYDATLNQAFSSRKANNEGKAANLTQFYRSTRFLLHTSVIIKHDMYCEKFWRNYVAGDKAALVSLMEDMITDEMIENKFLMQILAHEPSTLLEEKKLKEKFKAYRGREFSDAFEEYKSNQTPPDFRHLSCWLADADELLICQQIYCLLTRGVPTQDIIRFCRQDPQGALMNFEYVLQRFAGVCNPNPQITGMMTSSLITLFRFHQDDV